MNINIEIPSEFITDNDHVIDYSNLKNKTIIGLSGYAKSGKDALAKYLVSRLAFKRISFADSLKDNLNEYFKDKIYEDLLKNNVEIEYADINFLNPPNAQIKEILRPYVIWFGETMKKLNGVHYWTNRAFSKIEDGDKKIVISDVRRENELEIFKDNKEYQAIRKQNRIDIGLPVSAMYDVDAEYNALLFFVNQIHNQDPDQLTKQTILKAFEDWLITDTFNIDARIQNIGDYHENYLMVQIRKMVEKYPKYFI